MAKEKPIPFLQAAARTAGAAGLLLTLTACEPTQNPNPLTAPNNGIARPLTPDKPLSDAEIIQREINRLGIKRSDDEIRRWELFGYKRSQGKLSLNTSEAKTKYDTVVALMGSSENKSFYDTAKFLSQEQQSRKFFISIKPQTTLNGKSLPATLTHNEITNKNQLSLSADFINNRMDAKQLAYHLVLEASRLRRSDGNPKQIGDSYFDPNMSSILVGDEFYSIFEDYALGNDSIKNLPDFKTIAVLLRSGGPTSDGWINFWKAKLDPSSALPLT